jgi:hypothetical protein
MTLAKQKDRLAKAHPRTSDQVIADQKEQAAKATASTANAMVPTQSNGGAVAVPDNRTPLDRYLDQVAPASIVGRMVKFSKDGKFVTHDDGEAIGEDVDFVALADQTLIGMIKFNGEGEPPTRHMGLLFDGFVMPPRNTLGDDDQTKWEIGLDGKPADPWQHHMYLVLQRGSTSELFSFVTSSVTGRRAVGNLLRHYNRLQKTHPDCYPVIRLKLGGFQHKDDRVGWVSVPVLCVVGRAPKHSAARPDTSVAADMNDQIPFL